MESFKQDHNSNNQVSFNNAFAQSIINKVSEVEENIHVSKGSEALTFDVHVESAKYNCDINFTIEYDSDAGDITDLTILEAFIYIFEEEFKCTEEGLEKIVVPENVKDKIQKYFNEEIFDQYEYDQERKEAYFERD